jgi:DNA-binding LacI/PurR family transcriptional regulator
MAKDVGVGRQVTSRATLADVARLAGVSPSTASLAFSGSGPVSRDARDRVLAAARTLGYGGPDPVARSLRRGRSGIVAVVVGERLGYAFRDPVMVQLLDGLSEEIGRLQAALLLVPDEGPGAVPGPQRLATLPIDAAVFADCGRGAQDVVSALNRRGVAVVGVDESPGEAVALVDIDDEGATGALVRHLAELGHRDIGVVTLPVRLDGRRGLLTEADLNGERMLDPATVTQRRIHGARTALAGLGNVRATFVETASNAVEEGEAAASVLLDGDRPPTALLAQSDVLALGCLRAASARGLAVPAQLSIAGFDGVDLHLLGGTELTTIVQPAVEKGRAAGRHVAALLAGERPADVRLPVHLRVGTTTGPAPATATRS